MTTADPLIMVGIATFRRNAMLEQCLESLNVIDLPDAQVCVAIADNSADRGAREVSEAWQARLRFPLDYLSEPTQGISQARNKLLEHALAIDADFVAFIDDDETAAPGWLYSLYEAIRTTGADVIQGAVRYVPEGAAPSTEIRTTSRPELSQVKAVGAGNVIFRTSLIKESGLRFDCRFSLTGGEDYDFFVRCRQDGATMLWTNKAVVSEAVPLVRLTRRYRLKRLFRIRATAAFSDRLRFGRVVVIGHLGKSVKSLIRGTLSMIFMPFYIVRGVDAVQERAYCTMEHFAKGCGRIFGLLGLNIRMYK